MSASYFNHLHRRSFTQQLLATVLILVGGSLTASAQTGGLTDVTFSVGSTSFGYGSLFIADRAGLFRKHGINAKMIISDSGNAATTVLIAGSVDFACSGPDQVLTARARGLDILLVGNLYRGAFGSLAVGPKLVTAAGINPNKERKIKILEGRTIATPSATSAYTAAMQRTAQLMGVNIKYTYMAQPAMAAALAPPSAAAAAEETVAEDKPAGEVSPLDALGSLPTGDEATAEAKPAETKPAEEGEK
jgi:ABC-type nitrate/sulfonate/bicarbonate transport system substrate-binding protein